MRHCLFERQTVLPDDYSFCFGVALLSSQLLRKKIKNWWQDRFLELHCSCSCMDYYIVALAVVPRQTEL